MNKIDAKYKAYADVLKKYCEKLREVERFVEGALYKLVIDGGSSEISSLLSQYYASLALAYQIFSPAIEEIVKIRAFSFVHPKLSQMAK